MTTYRFLRKYKFEDRGLHRKPVISSELVMQFLDGDVWKDVPVVDDLESRRVAKEKLNDWGFYE